MNPTGIGRISRLFASRQGLRLERIRDHFDAGWYRATYLNDSGTIEEAWEHYQNEGRVSFMDAAPWFSVDRYLADHPDVAASGPDAFEHYVLTGRAEGRCIHPSSLLIAVNSSQASSEVANPQPRETKLQRRRQKRGAADFDAANLMERLFDKSFYLADNPDVTAIGIDPFTHFVENGFREGRDPTPWFSTNFYLKVNPEVLSADINPFLHFLEIGKKEGRLPRDPLGEWRTVVSSLPNIIEQDALWNRVLTSSILPIDALVREINSEIRKGGYGSLGLIVGNDDYLRNSGGIQACISIDVMERGANGRATLYLWPAQLSPNLVVAGEPDVNLRLNGRSFGATSLPELAQALQAIANSCEVESDLTVHGLMGHSPESFVALVRDSGNAIDRVVFWAHDYFAACSCYTLAPYANEFCGSPKSDSVQCRVCPYGVGRNAHLASIREFLDLPNTLIITPSIASQTVFRHATGWSGPIRVQPLGDFEWLGLRREITGTRAPIRIAFVGYPSPRKGWFDFMDLVRWCAGRSDVTFYHIGSADQKIPMVSFVPVNQLEGETNAMTETLREHGIDVVLHWPTWPETFAITAHEALAAGCQVLTNNVSGNIAALAKTHEHVLTLDSSTLAWMLRRGLLVPWLREKRKTPLRWGRFALGGISQVHES